MDETIPYVSTPLTSQNASIVYKNQIPTPVEQNYSEPTSYRRKSPLYFSMTKSPSQKAEQPKQEQIVKKSESISENTVPLTPVNMPTTPVPDKPAESTIIMS